MSELVGKNCDSKSLRWHLLTTGSLTALIFAAQSIPSATAADNRETDTPTVWVELGGQLERVDGSQIAFAPEFVDSVVSAGFSSPLSVEKSPRYSNGGQGKISFQPSSSDWLFSVSLRYGRSNGSKHVHQQVQLVTQVTWPTYAHTRQRKTGQNYSDTRARFSESHSVVDFQVGRDVGLGMFGMGDVNLGVRLAQFSTKSNIAIAARPDFGFVPLTFHVAGYTLPVRLEADNHEYSSLDEEARSFRGIGPSINWESSIPLRGQQDTGQFVIDWGANAALLFGRQKVDGHHNTGTRYQFYAGRRGFQKYYSTTQTENVANHSRTKSVVVPNVGGFLAVSANYSNAKLSLGYRADFFFGAMDAGIDARRTETISFHGPFASLSIGLGGG